MAIRYNNIFLIMNEKNIYLILRVRVDEDNVPLSLKIVHNPNSRINAKNLYGYYQEINIDEKEYFYYEADYAFSNIKINWNRNKFYSKDKYDSLIIYYDNQNYINNEFTEILNKNITTDSMKKENDKYFIHWEFKKWIFLFKILKI